MNKWNQSYLTIENLPAFLHFPPTIFMLFLITIILLLFIFIKIATILSLYNIKGYEKRPDIMQILWANISLAFRSFCSRDLLLPFFTLLLYLFTNIPILAGMILYARIDFGRGASDAFFIKSLLLLCLFFLGFIVFPGIFVMNFYLEERQGFFACLENSKILLKGRTLRTAGIFLFFNLILTIGFYLIYYLVLVIAALLTYVFADKSLVITVFLSNYPKINVCLTVLFSMISIIMNLKLIISLYQTYQDKNTGYLAKKNTLINIKNPFPEKKIRPLVLTLLLFLMAYGIFIFYFTVRNDSFYLKETLPGIRISSHRGNSEVSPENTLPALENAIIARSDYAEIDVRQTKDGELILLHDNNLRRTAGLNKNIQNLTYKQIKKLDVGSWFGKEFRDTKIPTLKEAFELCKGKIMLNIEMKPNLSNQLSEEKLVELIEKNNYVHQIQLSSWDPRVLMKIKKLNPEIKTGLILSGVYGNFFNKDYIDFFSIRSGFITRNTVENAHMAGKEVHAWTVNTENDIQRMKSLGVDCIITNNPTLAKEILVEDNTNESLIRLLKRMLNNRSFYRIVQDFN